MCRVFVILGSMLTSFGQMEVDRYWIGHGTCVRTANMGTHFWVWYCFLACVRPPDSNNTITSWAITKQIHTIYWCFGHRLTLLFYTTFSRSQLWGSLISPTSNNNHFVQVASTGTIGLSSLITELHRLCSRSLLLTWFIRLVQSEFRFLRYFTDTWGYTSTRLLQLPRTQVVSFSSRTTTYFSQGYRGYVMYILLV